MDSKNLHSGHRKRVKENVIKNGFSQLEEHKLLELMLFYSIPREDTNELAHKLLNEFGTLDELFKASIDRLKRVDGVGDNTAVMIATIGELFLRAIKTQPAKKKNYKKTDDLKELCKSALLGEKVENIFTPGLNGPTFGGNPVCCAGAINILDRINDNLLKEVNEKSKYIFDTLSGAKGIESVTGIGLMIGIKTKKDAKEVVNKCMENGVLVLTAKDKVRLLPALNIPFDLLKKAISVLCEICSEN